MFAITINNNYNKKIEADILAIKGEVMNKEIVNQTFMVIDFETVTPKGVPPEPIQLGLVQIDNLEISQTKRKSWFIKPPDFAPLTKFDTQQAGITEKDLKNAKSSKEIFDILELICGRHDYIFIAQNANYELGICKRFYEGREKLSKIKFVDTIKLAKIAFPNEKTYKLDRLAELCNIEIPKTRHTALTDCVLTGEIFVQLVNKTGIKDTNSLLSKAGINNDNYTQMSLF